MLIGKNPAESFQSSEGGGETQKKMNGMVLGYGFKAKGVSSQLVINEIDASTATPLQAVKLLALYLSGPDFKVWICA
ncbi:hypothetical protein C1H46_015169 [Malus baccata]|uniref:Uncharacterized protein n=1 Tax=Malus baccata TaxID=106549 RepID=A0A540MKE7_MALBA|nr:hypothetical protein C1H46_015169 [Malus baccata]